MYLAHALICNINAQSDDMVVKAVLHNIAILMTKRSARKIVAHKYLIILKYCTFSKRTAHQEKRWHMCFVAHPHMSKLTSKRYEWVNNKTSTASFEDWSGSLEELMLMGGEGGAVVSEGRVAEAVGTEFKLTSDGEEEAHDEAVRGGVGSIDATPNGPGPRSAAAWVRAEQEAEDAGETKGLVREGVVEVTAPVVVTETERVVVGVAAVGGVVALSRGDWAARNDEPGVTAALARDGEDDDDIVKAAVVWIDPGVAGVAGVVGG